MVTSPDQYPIWRTPKPVIIARGVRHDYRYSIRSAHDVEAEPGHVRSVKTNTPELHKEDDFGVTPPEPPDVPLKKPSPTPGASRLVIVCYHLPVRVVRDAQNNWTASWGSSIIAKSPSESIADSRETWWAGTIHGGLNRRQLTSQDKDEIRAVLLKMNCIPVFSANSEEGYLNYCKRILWPSFHNVTVLDQCCAAWHERAEWDQDAGSSWSAYEAMNEDFRDMLLDFLRAGDTVWVHDYHLMLLPSLLATSEPFRVDRHQSRKARIVFFFTRAVSDVAAVLCVGERSEVAGGRCRGGRRRVPCVRTC
jgi:trehalose 6-phosphate synthase/phosphatase